MKNELMEVGSVDAPPQDDRIEKSEGLQHPVNIVPIESLIDKNLSVTSFVWLNRESSVKQESHHAPKKEELKKAHQRLFDSDAPFNYFQITASGRIEADLLEFPSFSPLYFMWLKEKIQAGLESTVSGESLYIVFCTRSRLMRPEGYDSEDKNTWDCTERDYDVFGCWLLRSFGERVKDIVFAMLFMGTAAEDRGYESRLGMIAAGRMRGRPRKNGLTASDRRRLKVEVIALAVSSAQNATRIFLHLGDKYCGGKLPISLRTVQHWVKIANLSKKRGRPVGTKKQPS